MSKKKMTAAEHRAAAAAAEKRVAESWERSDTDGFLSQWAGGLTAEKHRLAAKIAERGDRDYFRGLYDGDRRVAAKTVDTRYGRSWLLRDDEAAKFGRKWVPTGRRSRIQKGLGLSERWELAPAAATIDGTGYGLSGRAWVTSYRTGDKWGLDAVAMSEDFDPHGE